MIPLLTEVFRWLNSPGGQAVSVSTVEGVSEALAILVKLAARYLARQEPDPTPATK